MPLFLIRRDMPGITPEELEAGAFRAVTCAFSYEGLKWITSYWDKTGSMTYCIYEAEDEAQIRDHAIRARIPCDAVTEVDTLGPEQFLEELRREQRTTTFGNKPSGN